MRGLSKYPLIGTALMTLLSVVALGQPGVFSPSDLAKYTPEWKGERFPDGRPRVEEGVLERLREVTLEEAWAVLRNAGYNHQYEEGWLSIHPEATLVGRALTAVWMPGRPDVHKVIEELGHKRDGRVGGQNAWPVDLLQKGDVYVCDHFGLKVDGPSIGDNVGNSIYAKSGNGIVYNGAVRDIEGLKDLRGFVSFVRSYHPSHHHSSLGPQLNSTLMGINCPIRIGGVLVMPGDIVLGKEGGVIFIPPHLAEQVVTTSEVVRLRDMFGHQRLREGRYTAGQIDSRWSDDIERDFSQWLRDHIEALPVAKEQIQEILKKRTW